MTAATSSGAGYIHTPPGPWMWRAIWTGDTPEFTPAMHERIRQLWSGLSPDQQKLELERMDLAYERRRANALDNAQKNSSVMTNSGLIIAAIVALLLSREPWVVGIGFGAILVLGAAIFIANVIFSPKSKNWQTDDVGCRAIDSLEAAAYDGGLFHHYIDAAEKFHHWDQLLLLERREFQLVCWLSNTGLVLTIVAVVVAGVMAAV